LIGYAGNGNYCYSNSLYMCLQAADAVYLPRPHEIECLTLMPFGSHYFEQDSRPQFFPDLFPLDPDQGLTMALRHLGWRCEKSSARPDDAPEQALARLRLALETGIVLLGPVDMGCLTYNPRARGAPSGADHFVVCLALEEDRVLLHDPQGYPFATLGLPDLLQAWQAEQIGYAPGAFTMRWAFQQVESLSPAAVRDRTLNSLRQTLSSAHHTSHHCGGSAALRRVADLLRAADPPGSLKELHHFALPLGARRSQDASGFLSEAKLPEAANALARKAELYGRSQYESVNKNWRKVAQTFESLAEAEDAFTTAILK
jgi:hypothetical protein